MKKRRGNINGVAKAFNWSLYEIISVVYSNNFQWKRSPGMICHNFIIAIYFNEPCSVGGTITDVGYLGVLLSCLSSLLMHNGTTFLLPEYDNRSLDG